MKTLFLCLAITIPTAAFSMCSECFFPYKWHLENYRDNYESRLNNLSHEIIYIEDIKDTRDQAIFYSGCLFCIEQMQKSEDMF